MMMICHLLLLLLLCGREAIRIELGTCWARDAKSKPLSDNNDDSLPLYAVKLSVKSKSQLSVSMPFTRLMQCKRTLSAKRRRMRNWKTGKEILFKRMNAFGGP